MSTAGTVILYAYLVFSATQGCFVVVNAPSYQQARKAVQ